nr:hypothetical protein [Tanacetum cinerariifolium]
VFVMIIEWESRIDDDSVLDFLSLDSMCPDERSRSTSFFAARLLFLPPGFSPASRLDVLPLEWIGLADLVDLVYVVKSKSLCIDDGIVSDHAKVQDRLDEELGNENDVVLFCLSVMCQTKPDGVNHATVNEDTHHGEDIYNDSDPQDCHYDADSSKNEGYERSRPTSFSAARLLFLPPGFSPASRLDVLPLEWIGLADLVDLVYVVKSKPLCIDDGIVSDHAKVQDRLDEELGNENDVVLFCLSVMCQTKLDGVNHATVNEDTHHGEDIYNDSDPQDCHYDADSSKNEGCKDDDDVMIDEELEIHEAKVNVHLFGIKESDYHFTTIWVSSEVPDNVFIEEGVYEIDINDFDTESGGEGDNPSRRRSSLNKLKKDFMQVEADGKNMLSIVVKFLVAQRKLKIGCIFTLLKLEGS